MRPTALQQLPLQPLLLLPWGGLGEAGARLPRRQERGVEVQPPLLWPLLLLLLLLLSLPARRGGGQGTVRLQVGGRGRGGSAFKEEAMARALTPPQCPT